MPSKKIILGTVQLGLPYGINNLEGKPDQKKAFEILDKAQKYQIEILDSADAYGDSLEVIGSYHRSNRHKPFKVISKFIGDNTPLPEKVQNTLNELGIKSLYGYLYHRFHDYALGIKKDELLKLQREHKIEKIGISVYSLEELEIAVQDKDITVIQVPFNPFDASTEKIKLLNTANLLGKEIHVRSIFLQGLFFKDPENLPGNLTTFKEPLQRFHEIIKNYDLSVTSACLNFALHQSYINNVLIGIESSTQLEKNIQAILPNFSQIISEKLKAIEIKDFSMLNPANWIS